MPAHDPNTEYALPYHWSMSPTDLVGGGADYWQYVEKVLDLVAEVPSARRARVLEVGCGDGRVSAEVARRFPEAKVTGIDIAERAVGFAKLLAPQVDFRRVDVFTLEESYDLILLVEVLEHIPVDMVPRFLSKLRSLLAPGGAFVLTVPSVNMPRLHPGHVQHFDEPGLRALLEAAGFRVERLVFHMDVRFSRYSRLGKLAIASCNNRLWTFKPGLSLLSRIGSARAFPDSAAHAARLIVKASPAGA